MNASAFLATIESEGVRLRRNGDELRIQTQRGASSDAYIDLIRLNKRACWRRLPETTTTSPGSRPTISIGSCLSGRSGRDGAAGRLGPQLRPTARGRTSAPSWGRVRTLAQGRCRCQRHRSVTRRDAVA